MKKKLIRQVQQRVDGLKFLTIPKKEEQIKPGDYVELKKVD